MPDADVLPRADDPRELGEILDAMAEAHLRQAAAAERDRRRDFVRTALECIVCSWLGILLVGWALHTTDATYGRVAFWGGLAVGNGGNVFALLSAYRRGERRGDW